MGAQKSYSVQEAARTLGVSTDVIRRAIHAGDIEVRYPKVAGRPISKPLIPDASLDAWLKSAPTERAS